MVNVSGLEKRSTFDQVEKEIQLDRFRNLVVPPYRLEKFILDAPTLTALSPENEEAMIQLEKKQKT